MGVLFEVEFASKIPTVNQWAIDGWVREGKLLRGDELVLVELGKEVTVRDIALAISPRQTGGRLTFSIDEQGFEVDLITRGMTFRTR
jgi:selenocysteine-specific translation elongation factor